VAISAVRTQHPLQIIVAVPVAPAETCSRLATQVDELVCLVAPELFFGVGHWYQDFSPSDENEVRELVKRAAGTPGLNKAS
jgi:putative phosphoribosyl transferase